MAFLTNDGSYPVNPLGSNDRYIILAHPSVANTLLLYTFGSDGSGYKPSQTIGLLQASDRTLQSIVATQATYKKTQWSDLSFVMSAAQANLFNQLLLAQTPASPITISDRIENPASPVDRLVIIDSPSGRAVFGNLSQYLVQFTATEV